MGGEQHRGQQAYGNARDMDGNIPNASPDGNPVCPGHPVGDAASSGNGPGASFDETPVRADHQADGSEPASVERFRRGPAAWWRHGGLSPDHVMRAFDDAAFDRIEAAIAAGEVHHRGEIRFAIESGLGWRALRRGLSPRARALQLFGEHRIWDTEENTGILIYLLTADHAVEIIADRLVHRALPGSVWQQACALVSEAAAPGGKPVEGVLQAIALLTQALTTALPAHPGRPNDNELDNRPLRL